MTREDFERLYRDEPDPWGYRTRTYERQKYAATLDACGEGPFARALELGASIGVFSVMLAPRCHRLQTIDFSATAVRSAAESLADVPQASALHGTIPDDIPDGPFDLVVASEILYYLEADALAETLARIERVLRPGGRLVCVHWRPVGPDRPGTADGVHALVRELPWLAPVRDGSTDTYRLDVLERR